MNDERRIGVISDTHFPSRGQVLATICVGRVMRCDLIVLAGDFCDQATLLQVLAEIGHGPFAKPSKTVPLE